MTPKLIIHGGAGSALEGNKSVAVVRTSLERIVTETYGQLTAGCGAIDAIALACQLLEDDPIYNAGTGSVLQSDGQVRMSASVMAGDRQSFSGIINVMRVQNPVHMARALQFSPDRVLSESGGRELARELQIPLYDPTTQQRRSEWMQLAESEQHKRVATSLAMGTVGAVALDCDGNIAAGTSTGGRGHERIGRVSDSATPAGNYASASAGVSCTGVGEDILDEGLATRIVVRVEDGMTLQAAMDKTFAEAKSRQRDFGAIALSRSGEMSWSTTTDVILVAHYDGDRLVTSLPDV